MFSSSDTERPSKSPSSGSVYEGSGDVDDSDSTPQPTRTFGPEEADINEYADTGNSFLADFVAAGELVRGVANLLVSATKAVAVSLLLEPREIPETQDTQLPRVSEYQPPFDSETHRSRPSVFSCNPRSSIHHQTHLRVSLLRPLQV